MPARPSASIPQSWSRRIVGGSERCETGGDCHCPVLLRHRRVDGPRHPDRAPATPGPARTSSIDLRRSTRRTVVPIRPPRVRSARPDAGRSRRRAAQQAGEAYVSRRLGRRPGRPLARRTRWCAAKPEHRNDLCRAPDLRGRGRGDEGGPGRHCPGVRKRCGVSFSERSRQWESREGRHRRPTAPPPGLPAISPVDRKPLPPSQGHLLTPVIPLMTRRGADGPQLLLFRQRERASEKTPQLLCVPGF